MAATGEIAVPASEQDDGFGDELRMEGGKKKKFKPFQKMRNFFRGSSKKQRYSKEGVPGAHKFHSTGALQHMDGDEDDGGFKKVPVGLAGSRSISEDSIFQPDQKEQPIGVLHGTTVSMERINSDFQNELFSKLKGKHSDSDIDEGISRSPMPTLTIEELAFVGRTKSAPVPGKSMSQESDSSLISVDGPENDEDLFQSNWKAGVASIATTRSRPSSSESQSDDQIEVMDFEEVQMRTPSLNNEAAKHRISVKPRTRKASSRMSTKHREAGTTHLPDLQEESPRKTIGQEHPKEDKAYTPHKAIVTNNTTMETQEKTNVTVIRTTIPVGNPIEPPSQFSVQRSEPRDIPGTGRPTTIAKDDVDSHNRPQSMSPLSTSPLSTAMLQDVKLRPRPTAGGKIETVENTTEQANEGNELSKAFGRAKRFSRKYDDEGNIASDKVKAIPQDVSVTVTVKDNEQRKQGIQSKEISVVKGDKSSPVSPVKESSPFSPSTAGVSFVLKKEPLRPGSKQDSTGGSNVTMNEKVENKAASATSVTAETTTKSDMPPKTDAKSPTKDRLGSPEKLASPKEEYRLKRAARSKTLPEPPAHKEVGSKANEADQTPKKTELHVGSPPLPVKGRSDYDNVMVGARAIQSKRASWASATVTTSSEPSWVVKSRLKQVDQKKETEGKKLDNSTATTDVKIAEKSVSESVVKAPEKNVTDTKTKDKSSMSVEPKAVADKPAPSPVKTWAQTHSAKPFEKPVLPSSGKTTTDKPPSVQTSSVKSAFEKPSVQSMKPAVTSQSSNSKSLSSSVKPSVAPPSTVNKPLSQSVKPAFDSKPALASQKPNNGINKTGFEAKTFTQNTVKPLTSSNTSMAKTEPIKSPVTAETKKPGFGAKKPDIDSKADAKTSVGGAKTNNMNEKAKTTQDKPKTEAAVPAWKQALNQRKGTANQPSQVKIEIIDKTNKKPEVVKAPEKKIEEKPGVQMRENKPKSTPEKSCSDAVGNRSSKVLDMVKSFQKLQVT